MDDQNYNIPRIQRVIQDALNLQRDQRYIQDALDEFKNPPLLPSDLKTVAEELQEMERRKAEALNPACYSGLQQMIHQVSADEHYRKMTEGIASALEDSPIAKTQRAMEGLAGALEDSPIARTQSVLESLNLPDYNKTIGGQMAEKFALLSTEEALTGAMQKSLWSTLDSIPNISDSLVSETQNQMTNLFESLRFSSALDEINEVIAEAVQPATLASARFLVAENFLQGRWPNATMQESIQEAISSVQTDYSGVLRQLEEFALDTDIREIVARANTQELIEEAAEILYQEEFAVEEAWELVEFGINSKAVLSLSDQTLKVFRGLLIFAAIALIAASANPEYASYVDPLQQRFMLLVALYTLIKPEKGEEKKNS